MKQDFQIQFLKGQGMQASDTILDVGCGTLRGGIPIIEFLDIGHYYGLEVRKHVLNEGKKELKVLKLEYKKPNLISFTNFSDLQINVQFQFVFAFSVLIHFENHIAESCFEFVSQHLKQDGVFYANVNIGNVPDGNWQGFPVVYRSINFYEDLANKNNMRLQQLGDLKSLGHVSGKDGSDKQIMLKMVKN
ncbi:class I SAM-dependent methyltransferase [Bizionia echini]|uniref:class I SAM-dependent methyltransferase n=1 Tax=Bizionia echini TaxID=649333 RepID=UPI0030D895C2